MKYLDNIPTGRPRARDFRHRAGRLLLVVGVLLPIIAALLVAIRRA